MKKLFLLTGAGLMLSLASCVNEWPEPEYRLYDVTLRVHSDTEWLPDFEMTYSRAEALELEYIFKIYKAGTTTNPVKEFVIYSTDFKRSDFNVDVSLYPGDYDVYVWSDYCNADNDRSLFYETSDFAKITYLTPYEGDSNNKDAFRGMKNFTIENTMYLNPTATEVINLERPLARYIFVATDLEDFVDNEITRGKLRGVTSREGSLEEYANELEDALGSYTVKIYYPLYMPSVFDNFLNKPIDSWTGISFEGQFTVISDKQAQIGFDYVMMNGSDSYVQVAMELWDAEGEVISRTSTINVPTKRDRTTLIYGRFLTSDEDAGVRIDPDFDGQFNIPYNR